MKLLAALLTLILLHQAQAQRLQPRYHRPHQDSKCWGPRCGVIEEVDHPQPNKERPPVLTRDDYPAVIGTEKDDGGKLGDDSSDSSSDDSEETKVEEDDYDLKPVGGGEYIDKPTDKEGYVDKPAVGRPDRPVGGGGYIDKPTGGGGYVEKPTGGGGYVDKPTDKGGCIDKPTGGRPDRPVGGGGYIEKPTGGRPNRPVGGGGYIDKPTGGGYIYEPTDGEGYIEKPTGGRPNRPVGGGIEYIDKPTGGRPQRPVGGGGYIDKPTGGGYIDKPTDGEEYIDKPTGGRPNRPAGGGIEYIDKPTGGRPQRPVGGGGYIDKPTGGRPNRPGGGGIEYIDKPTGGRPQRPVGGGGYIDKPTGGRPGRPGRGDYKPKPGNDESYHRPDLGGYDNPKEEDETYRRPVGKPDLGGYDNPKEEDETYRRPVGKPDLGGYDNPKEEDETYRRPVGKPDLGGYDNPKEEDETYRRPIGKPDVGGYDAKDEGIKKETLEDEKCICVPYYQCTDGHIVTDGAGIIDARKRPEPEDELPLDGKFIPPSCGPFHVCCNTPETSTVKPYEHRCGVRNPSGINSRILSPTNKGEADFGEWPWQAAILKSEGDVNIFQCGGVLIDKHHVLTVAHCVFHLYQQTEYPLKVRLGEWDTQTTSEFLAHEDYRVARIFVHPEFRNASLWNDLAVLKLEQPVLFAPHIDTVCLPRVDEDFAGHNCIVTGWGKDAYNGGSFSNVMKEVALGVIDNYKCEEQLRKTRLGSFFQLHDGFVCAGGEHGVDSCKGDGGGPLVCFRKDKSYALAGLVSWGIDCGQPGVPGVYVRIQKYLNWISKVTGLKADEYWPKLSK